MRLRLSLDHPSGIALPLNYQYYQSAWIYKQLALVDQRFADWLHSHGYSHDSRNYKLFCFSMLYPQRYKIIKAQSRILFTASPTRWTISFLVDEAVKHLVKAVFEDNSVSIRSKQEEVKMQISGIDMLPEPVFDTTMNYEAKTPIALSRFEAGKKYAQFISIEDDQYEAYFVKNLVNKANAWVGEEKFKEKEVSVSLDRRRIHNKAFRIKNSLVKGHLYSFELKAPVELQRIGYYAGFGIQNSALGMGYCEVI